MPYCGRVTREHPIYYKLWYADQYWSEPKGDFVLVWVKPVFSD